MKRVFLIFAALAGMAFSQANQQNFPANALLFAGVPSGSCTASQSAINTVNGNLYTCSAGSWSLATGTTALSGITGGVQGERFIGLSASGGTPSTAAIDATAFCSGASFSAGKCTTQDMCFAINAAAAQATLGTGEVDARGFYGKNVCSAANLTLMLNNLGNGGHVYLGNVHLYVNGPCAATPCSTANTTNFSFNDGAGLGLTPGTPALLIPPKVVLEGTIMRPDGAFGTNIELCQANNNPSGSGCTQGAPQRSYPVTSIICPTTGTIANQHACVVTVTPASGTSCGNATTCAPNSGVAISARDCGAANPTWAWTAGSSTHANNFAGTISLCTATGFTMQAAVDDNVSGATINTNCNPCTGVTVYLPTPILGFMNGDLGTSANTGATTANAAEVTNTVTLTLTSGNYPAGFVVGASVVVASCSVSGYNITALILSGGTGTNALTYTDPTGSLGAATGCLPTVPISYVNSNSGNSVCYGCYAKGLALTSTNYEGSVGFEDLFGQERSGADHLSFTQGAWGIAIRGPQTQNGGPFDVMEDNAGGFTSCEGHGYAWLQAAGAVRGLRGTTYNAGTSLACNSQAEQSNAMIVWDSQGMNLDTLYLSGGYDGILVGSQKTAHGLNIFNLFCGAGTVAISCQGNTIAYSAAFSPTDVGVFGASVQNATFLNALKNYVTGSATGTDAQIQSYFYDNNGAGKIQEISTSELFPNQSGSGWKENITSLGNQTACSATYEGVSWVVNNCNAACSSGTTSCTSGGTTHCEMRCNGTSWIQTGR